MLYFTRIFIIITLIVRITYKWTLYRAWVTCYTRLSFTCRCPCTIPCLLKCRHHPRWITWCRSTGPLLCLWLTSCITITLVICITFKWTVYCTCISRYTCIIWLISWNPCTSIPCLCKCTLHPRWISRSRSTVIWLRTCLTCIIWWIICIVRITPKFTCCCCRICTIWITCRTSWDYWTPQSRMIW